MPDLYLLRHAKSDWATPGRPDRERNLAERGIGDAIRMGEYMQQSGFLPDSILCSDATRTRQTLDHVKESWQQQTRIMISDRLYSGNAQAYFNLLIDLPETCENAMLIGHNPTIHELALALVGDGPPSDITQMSRKYPTCALAVIRFKKSTWSDIGQGDGRLMEFATPKALA